MGGPLMRVRVLQETAFVPAAGIQQGTPGPRPHTLREIWQWVGIRYMRILSELCEMHEVVIS